ncbi:hypothetical protein ACWEQL_41170, partial [Kitasatospora sp. NPDC004240]
MEQHNVPGHGGAIGAGFTRRALLGTAGAGLVVGASAGLAGAVAFERDGSGAAPGAAFGGALGVTTTSGPGI